LALKTGADVRVVAVGLGVGDAASAEPNFSVLLELATFRIAQIEIADYL